MNADSKDFLKLLVETASPSGYEHEVQKLVRSRIQPWCDTIRTDVMGNVFGIRNPEGRPRIMLAGHCDQIGFIVQYITDEGFLHVEPIGGVDPVVATSQRVSIMTRQGMVPGVIGRKAIHLMDDEDKKKVPKIHDLYVDIGAENKYDALKFVSFGDAGIFVQPYVELAKVTRQGDLAIIFTEIMPNLLPYLLMSFAFSTVGAMVAEVGIAVIGLGPSDAISLGMLINFASSWGAFTRGLYVLLLLPPAILILIFLALTMINRGMEEYLNPRLQNVTGK